MTHEQALTLVRGLSCLRDYPRTAEGEANLAVALRKHAGTLQVAREVVSRFEEQCPTPKAIRETAEDIRGIGRVEFPTYGPRPDVQCFVCNDAGCYTPEGKTETVWCECSQAEKLRAEIPDWVDKMNAIAKRISPKRRTA